MSDDEFISIEVYATNEGLHPSFIHSLHERDLIRISVVHDRPCVPAEDLARIEQLARMHYDLEINLEGVEAICHLLERMEAAQAENRLLREKLRVYEEDEDRS